MRYSTAIGTKILVLHEEGLSGHQIARRVRKRPSCVNRFLRTGPARILSVRDERAVKRLVLSGSVDTASELSRHAAELELPAVSAKTFRRALRRQGLVARVKPRKLALTESHKRGRLTWARQHRHWTVADWAKVIFCDETKLLRVNLSGRL